HVSQCSTCEFDVFIGVAGATLDMAGLACIGRLRVDKPRETVHCAPDGRGRSNKNGGRWLTLIKRLLLVVPMDPCTQMKCPGRNVQCQFKGALVYFARPK